MSMNDELYPTNYKIQLKLDLDCSTFEGTTVINIYAENFIDAIVLNAEDLAIWDCYAKKNENPVKCAFSMNPQKQEFSIFLPEKMKDRIELTIVYLGKYNKDLLGLYRSKYEQEGKESYIISSQFEESYARRAFPCFDHPSMKATFNVEYIINQNLKAIGNMPILEEKVLEASKKLVRFEQTPKMCTYLLYFGVGEFEIIDNSSLEHLVRVVTTPGKAQYGKFAMEIAQKSLEFCELYTGIKYPIAKCDLIGVPAFQFGAMENYGAIAYREAVLLLYPELTSSLMRLMIASVTAHEVSHFWFGDLVSPMDWIYIWLNESFASYFTFSIADDMFPGWHAWEHFITQYYITALERDGLIETYPVELPGGEKDFISPAKTDIVYNKGASVLRMLKGFLGDANFKKGINYFLNKYQFSCVNSEQYWTAFEDATHEPIKKFAESWVHQPGFPIVNVIRKNEELILTQERFTYLPYESDLLWLIPINIVFFLKNGESKIINTTLEEKSKIISIPPDTRAFKLNFEQTGFYRVKYEKEILDDLGQLIIENNMTPLDRFGIESDLFALVVRGDQSLIYYLEFIKKYFTNEEEYLPLISIFTNLKRAYTIVNTKRNEITETGVIVLKNYFEKFGFEPVEGEENRRAILRGFLLWAAFSLEYPDAVEKGTKYFQELLESKKVHRDILSSVLKIGAATDERSTNYLLRKVLAPDTPEIEKLYVLEAMGCYKEKKKILDALKITLKQVPDSSRYYVFSGMGRNRNAIEFLWQWFLKNQRKLEQESSIGYARAIVSLIPLGGLDKEAEVKQFFNEHMEKKDLARDTIKMVLEQLEINSRLRNG